MVDEVELAFYRTLASFSSKSSYSVLESKIQASNLYKIVERFVTICHFHGLELPVELLNLLVLTINSTLHADQQSRTPKITDDALYIIYTIIKLLHDSNIKLWNRINSSHFNRNSTRIFIFPGLPRKKGWEFVFGEFAFLNNTVAKRSIPLEYVQHVVHDIDDVITILETIPGKAYFKGSYNEDFSGHPLCWFAPLPPPWTDKSTLPCDSLDPNGSRYGCFRFNIPITILIQRFPTCYILGTRKYNQEHAHTILLTDSSIKCLTLIEKRQPVKLTDTVFIQSIQVDRKEICNDKSLRWLCYHDDPWVKWDHLEFAIATKGLQFNPHEDNIRLDFINHDCKICVPSFKTNNTCKHPWNKNTAMEYFLTKLNEKNIDLDSLMRFFTDDVWNELLAVKQSLSSKRLRR